MENNNIKNVTIDKSEFQFVQAESKIYDKKFETKPIGYFKFENTPELHEVRSKYNQAMLLVEPKMFINNLQSLKAEVVNMFQNPNSEANR